MLQPLGAPGRRPGEEKAEVRGIMEEEGGRRGKKEEGEGGRGGEGGGASIAMTRPVLDILFSTWTSRQYPYHHYGDINPYTLLA